MKKRILIIQNAEEPIRLKGVPKDVERYATFFTSLQGGAWDRNEEIMILPNCASKETVLSALDDLETMDYSIVIFTGHGGTHWDDEAYVWLNDEETLLISDLKRKGRYQGQRRLLITDCCRVYDEQFGVPLQESMESHRVLASDVSDLWEYVRQEYENRILALPAHIACLYSCSLDEVAEEEGHTGGKYTYNLIKYLKNWRSAETNDMFLDALNAQNAIIEQAIQESWEQIPDYSVPRLTRTFPLAIDWRRFRQFS